MVVNFVNSTQTLADRYRDFSWWQARGQCDAHEELTARIGQDPEFCELLAGSLPPGNKQQPNLLLAAVRHLEGPHAEQGPRGDLAYRRWREWTVRHWDEVCAVIMQRATQTNEPARCATLLPLLARLPQPLALLEVGASAGLCLYPDRYRYAYEEYGAAARGPVVEAGAPDSPVTFRCRTSREARVPDGCAAPHGPLPEVVWRAGIDLNPLDPADDPDALRWLQALVWPGATGRARQLAAAVDAVRGAPRPRIVRGDLVDELPALAADAPADATLVVFHTSVLTYLPLARRERFAGLVRTLLTERPGPGHWISQEHHSVLPWIAAPRSDVLGPAEREPLLTLSLDERPVALTGQHGQSLHWVAGTR
ncbi:DUF2332 domain-containing protein [Streptomyces pinistramenti]|uniref:DUF2332 domain-containing protein n=1 Tax=Streptomyces pinistramenti TaxID=2884812 RepID=UPI001D06155D|nr:DUF2332 domain-containing protein [Streptomyces pinistramenti]MCB5910968.1 DUF2332 domain-containing protein [Streptomyces pinistramenti]